MSKNQYTDYLKLVNYIIYSEGIEIDSEWDIMDLQWEIENEKNMLEVEKKYLLGKLYSCFLSNYINYPVWKLNTCFRTSLAYRYTVSHILKISDEYRKVKWFNSIYKSLVNDCKKGIISNSFASTIAFYLLEDKTILYIDIGIYESLNNLYNNSIGI